MPTWEGSLFAIFPSGIDLALLSSYDCCWPIPDDENFLYPGATHGRHSERLAEFVAVELRSNASAVTVCENWRFDRATIAQSRIVRPRIAFFHDEVYHLLTPEITDRDLMEDTLWCWGRYQTGVCSSCEHLPGDEISDEQFLDEVARNARHVFVPAFDGSGYLIWSKE